MWLNCKNYLKELVVNLEVINTVGYIKRNRKLFFLILLKIKSKKYNYKPDKNYFIARVFVVLNLS